MVSSAGRELGALGRVSLPRGWLFRPSEDGTAEPEVPVVSGTKERMGGGVCLYFEGGLELELLLNTNPCYTTHLAPKEPLLWVGRSGRRRKRDRHGCAHHLN